jgi:hypothetical protein
MANYQEAFSKYFEVFKIPLFGAVAWMLAIAALSFFVFDLYAVLDFFSLPVYLALGLYIGFKGYQAGMAGKRAIALGLIFGILFGLVIGATGWYMIKHNAQYVMLYDEMVQSEVEHSGGTITSAQVVDGMASILVISSPVVWGIIFGVLAFLGSVAAKFLKPKPKNEEPLGVEPPRDARPSKKFKRSKR